MVMTKRNEDTKQNEAVVQEIYSIHKRQIQSLRQLKQQYRKLLQSFLILDEFHLSLSDLFVQCFIGSPSCAIMPSPII